MMSSSKMSFKSLSPYRNLRSFIITCSILFLVYIFISFSFPTPPICASKKTSLQLKHVVFGIASSSDTFTKRKEFIRSWWPHGATRGFVFVDEEAEFNENDNGFVRVVVSNDDWKKFPYSYAGGLRSAVRLARICKELIQIIDQEPGDDDVRWIVLGDDDTFFFTENLVKTLAKYEWEKYYYIGGLSESVAQNLEFSFGMAYGGAGLAISYPLAKVLSTVLDSCLMRYSHLYGSDSRIYVCLSELGVELTHEPGFHQVDLRGSLFGLLTAHPLTPIVSLHHLEHVDPLYPGMNHTESLNHLVKVSNIDQGRIFQQTVCYDSSRSRTISISWGYVVQIYEGNVPLPDLLSVPETFVAWKHSFNDFYMFKTREFSDDLCESPTIFHLKTVLNPKGKIESRYNKHVHGTCKNDVVSTQKLQEVTVYSEEVDHTNDELFVRRRDCCDVLPSSSETNMEINIRKCRDGELIAMSA